MKKRIKIFNIVFMLIAAAALATMSILPAFNFDLSVGVEPDRVVEMIPVTEETKKVDIKKIVNDALNNQPLEISVGMEVTANELITSFTNQADDMFFQKLVVDNIEENAQRIINVTLQVATEVIKTITRDEVTNSIKNAIISVAPTPEIAEQIFNNQVVITSIQNLANDAILKLAKNESGEQQYTNIDDFLNNYLYIEIDKIFDIIANECSDIINPQILDIAREEAKANIGPNIIIPFTNFGIIKEDGITLRTLDIVIASFTYDMLNTEKDQTYTTPEDKAMHLVDLMEANLMAYVDGNMKTALSIANKAVFFILLAFLAYWLIFIVFTFIRTLRKEKCWTQFGVFFWIVGFLQMAIGFGAFALQILGSNVTKINEFLSNGSPLAIQTSSISIMTSSFIPAILVAVCIILVIIYNRYRKQMKIEYKARKLKEKEEIK